MAIWQFDFALVPRMGIVEHHGKLVDVLPEYAAHDPDAPPKGREEFHDYWKGQPVGPASLRELETLLPPAESWSRKARMFGDSESDLIEIWDDDVYCRIDVRRLDLQLVDRIVAIAERVDCRIVVKDGGRVLPPSLSVILAEINASNSMRFVRDPRAYLEAHARMAAASDEGGPDGGSSGHGTT